MSNDDRTFRLSFPDEGIVRLRETVKEKLKDYMGDYTDETLVDYVIVLIRNGRRKEEAGKELNVFLGDDSISFSSWLWDHLSSNLNLYLLKSEEQSGKLSLQHDEIENNLDLNSDYEIESLDKLSKIRHNKEWKGLLQDDTKTLVLRSTVVDNSSKKITQQHVSTKRSSSPKKQNHKKRSQPEEPPKRGRDEQPRSHLYKKPRIRQDERARHQLNEKSIVKREVASRPMLNAPCRLLQSAVRDAVMTVQKSVSRPELPLKRLRSIVSSPIDSSASGVPQNSKSVPKFMGSAKSALKAAEEAAQDVKVKTPVTIFDRLCHSNERSVLNDSSSNPSQNGDYSQVSQHLGYAQSNECGNLAEDLTKVERNIRLESDSGSQYEGYNNADNLRREVGGTSHIASSSPRDRNSLMIQYSNSKNANDIIRNTMTKQETLNTSAIKETQAGNHKKKTAGKFQTLSTMGNEANDTNKLSIKNEIMLAGDSLKETLKTAPSQGQYSNNRSSDDADTRIVFVNNVHFAATKDTLSHHFNKVGEVLKVIIVTDVATGNPTGSAYVEFLHNESVELALSLDGTSFMSRILKVVRRNMASHETSSITPWPRVARGSPFTFSRGTAVGRGSQFPRGTMTSPFRGRPTANPYARSIQWKRDSYSSPGTIRESVKNSNSTMATPIKRNLTYIRAVEPKADMSLDPR